MNNRRCPITKEPSINREIKAAMVRVIADNEQLGIMPLAEALAEAGRRGLDLVEVAPNAAPPVCRILDYGKYRYQQSKKMQDARKNQTVIQLKEIRLRPKTDDHDIQVKIKHIRKFLAQNDKVKVSMLFRGREIAFTELGKKMMEDIIASVADISLIDQPARLEGRNMVMILAPKK
jgi:translation initiation factor IF-3